MAAVRVYRNNMPLSMDPTVPLIQRTDAIALRISPFSRTSHVVTWLSPEHGRVATVVKGACRPKSAFLGQYDICTTCELLFYRHEHESVHAIRECTPLAPRDALRDDWRRITTASYLCDLVARVAQPGQESTEIFQLLESTLDELCTQPATPDIILRFELNLLHHLGFLPHLEDCPECHAVQHPWLRFALAAGRVNCRHTTPIAANESAVTVHRDVLTHLHSLMIREPAVSPENRSTAKLPHPSASHHWTGTHAAPHRLPPAQPPHLSLGSRRFLGIFMRFHLDTPAAPRRLAFELLETCPATLGLAKGDRQ